MALFERDWLPARSTLSRFLAALTEAPVDALRSVFLDDLERRPLSKEKQTGGLADRAGNTWVVFDLDGTREAARQRALPQTQELPPAFGRPEGSTRFPLSGSFRRKSRFFIEKIHYRFLSVAWHLRLPERYELQTF